MSNSKRRHFTDNDIIKDLEDKRYCRRAKIFDICFIIFMSILAIGTFCYFYVTFSSYNHNSLLLLCESSKISSVSPLIDKVSFYSALEKSSKNSTLFMDEKKDLVNNINSVLSINCTELLK